jgi:hypothetical protein
MLERGEISFLLVWVLNPLIILFFQNCSMAPPEVTQAVFSQPAVAAEVNKSPDKLPPDGCEHSRNCLHAE